MTEKKFMDLEKWADSRFISIQEHCATVCEMLVMLDNHEIGWNCGPCGM